MLDDPDTRAPAGFDPGDIAPPPFRERDRHIDALALDVSGRCNLACRYCAEAATQPRRRTAMSESTLDAAWQRLIDSGGEAETKSIRLGSGEPLLAKPLLKRLARHMEQARRDGSTPPSVFLTTNGTLLDAATRDWLVQTGWHVKVSLDGPAAIHDRWRVSTKGRPTHARAAEAVEDLAARIPERFSVTAVLCRGTDPARAFLGVAGLGVRRIEMVPVAHQEPAILPDQRDLERYRDFLQDYVKRYLAGERDLPQLVKLIDGARRVMGYDVTRVGCGAGRNFFAVGPEGGLYPCFRFIGVDRYRMGDVAQGPDTAAAHSFQRTGGRPYDARDACGTCWAAPLCGGPCFAVAEMFGPGAGHPFALHCRYIRADARAAVELVQQLREEDPERLLALISDFVEL